jgi:hypothetical protein
MITYDPIRHAAPVRITLATVDGVLKDSCPRQDSNLRPTAPEAVALSPELRGRGRRDRRRGAYGTIPPRQANGW